VFMCANLTTDAADGTARLDIETLRRWEIPNRADELHTVGCEGNT
jgi:hypothetical protein